MNPLQFAFRPLTLPYGAWMRLRAAAYRHGVLQQKSLRANVISVGNLTTGGTGKTPMVLYIAGRLVAQGHHPAILTRGYRGISRSASAGNALSSLGSTSDEVQVLRSRLGDGMPIGVGADRLAIGRGLESKNIDYFVLDDGFQHMRLARDVNIVLIDATNPFGGGYLLPAGRLREPRSALARANLIVITRSRGVHAPALETAVRRYTTAPVFYSHTTLESVHRMRDAQTVDDYGGNKCFAFCGIGNPKAFFDDLRTWKFNVVGHRAFRDHHLYRQAEAHELMTEARRFGADALVCTEKDVFNLRDVKFEQIDVLYCRIGLSINREDDFWGVIQELTASRRESC